MPQCHLQNRKLILKTPIFFGHDFQDKISKTVTKQILLMGLSEFCIKSWKQILKTPNKQSLWTEEDFCSKYDIHHQIDRLL